MIMYNFTLKRKEARRVMLRASQAVVLVILSVAVGNNLTMTTPMMSASQSFFTSFSSSSSSSSSSPSSWWVGDGGPTNDLYYSVDEKYTGEETEEEERENNTCVWAPDQSKDCEVMLSRMICRNERRQSSSSTPPQIGRRFLVFGDSTFGPDHLFKYLSDKLVMDPQVTSNIISPTYCGDRYHCEVKLGAARQCGSNNSLLYGISPDSLDSTHQWRRPIMPFEGASQGPFCSNCKGCVPTFVECNLNLNSTIPASSSAISTTTPTPTPTSTWWTSFLERRRQRNGNGNGNTQMNKKNATPMIYYGGYFPIEFARDVEIQSNNYSTTQENILLQYLRPKWNTPELVRDFGKPVCIVGAGIHDAGISTMTQDIFVDNVRWYLQLLQQVCSLIFWTANTAPKRDTPTRAWRQHINQTRDWNAGVRDLITTEFQHTNNHSRPRSDDDGASSLSSSSSSSSNEVAAVAFIDVFEASLGRYHLDNIHLVTEWYSDLSTLFDPQRLPNQSACAA